MSGLSLYAAICRGVSPCFSLASGEAPALMSASAAERPAPAAAQCRGVMPSLSALSAGAPQARSSSAAFSFPARRAAESRGSLFFPVRWRMSAPARRSAGIMRERPRRTARARGVSENPRMLRKSGFVPQPVILASVSLSSAKSSAVTAPMRAARHRSSESAMPGRGRLSAVRAGEGRLSVPA